jgi:hypothetical protein
MFASVYSDEKLVLMPARARKTPFGRARFRHYRSHDVIRRAGVKREVAQILDFGDRRCGKVPAQD